ncbi:MAG TPA: transglycosylase SLT domain-containing protein [Casimicrobiaceae bacterium]
MTTKLLFAFRRTGLLGREPLPRQSSSTVVPLFAALAAVMLSASTVRLDPSASRSLDPVADPAPVVGEPRAAPARASPARPRNVEALVAALARKYRVSQAATRELVAAAYREAGRNGLDPLLIIAVIGIESRFNPIAQSEGGALGLMQVIPRYHKDKLDAASGESILDPRTNIYIGARVLKEYIRRGGTEIAGLQLYNGAVDDESNAYANKVLLEKQRLQSVIRQRS